MSAVPISPPASATTGQSARHARSRPPLVLQLLRAGRLDQPLAADFALFGAKPALAEPLPVGQLYFPDWARYEAAMRTVFASGWYTNHGPLAQQLEARLAQRMRVRHVVCVTNATLGLVMACEALGLTGKVILPAFTFIATAQALSWAKLEPVFCDVDPATHQITAERVAPLIDAETSAILAVNLWGDACPAAPLQALADRHGLKLFFDSAHAMGCEIGGVPVGNFGSMEVFSFHATKVFSTVEGGCIATNDDALAARLRNIRSSYGAGEPVDVVKTSNGRMSEAQAAIGLMNLDDFEATLANNRALFSRYREGLRGISGISLFEARNASKTNHQYVVCEIDEASFGLSREALLGLLKAENIIARRYFHPGAHRSVPYVHDLPQFVDALPETDRLNARLIQLPSGALVKPQHIAAICERIASAGRRAAEIRSRTGAA